MINSRPPKRQPFAWAEGWPHTDDQFEALMWGIDVHLHKENIEVVSRPYNVVFLVADAFGVRQKVSPSDELADMVGYEGDILIAKARRWYRQVYGDRIIMESVVGHVPVRLGNALWRARVPIIFEGECAYFADRDLSKLGKNGTGEDLRPDSFIVGVPRIAKVNGFCLVKGLLQGMADRIPAGELEDFKVFCEETLSGAGRFSWLSRRGELLSTAYRDYASSTDNLLNGRYEQSRWDSEQAVEKVLKELLKAVGEAPEKTHNLINLAASLQPFLTKPINSVLLDNAAWPTGGRYAEKSTTVDECLRANHAVLKIAKQLSEDAKMLIILGCGIAHMA